MLDEREYPGGEVVGAFELAVLEQAPGEDRKLRSPQAARCRPRGRVLAVHGWQPKDGDAQRVTSAFNRVSSPFGGESGIDVSFSEAGIIVTARLRRRRRVRARCGQTGRQLEVHDHRTKRWRYLDLGSARCKIECELRLLRCPDCGVRMESFPWARAGAHHTRDFEDVVAWLAQQMAAGPITGLLRIGWDTVGVIVARVTADHLDDRRLDGLIAIGVDEISCSCGQRCLTSVADHHSGAIVWCAPGRNSATLPDFFAQLGERKSSIRAVSIDMSGECQRAIRAATPQAEVCFDPFHVCRLASRVTDRVRRDEWNAHDRSHTAAGRWVKGTRWSLLRAPANQAASQLATLHEAATANRRLCRAFLLREELRLPCHLEDPALAPAHLDAWLRRASRSQLKPFVRLARTIREHREGVLAAIRPGLSNDRLEELNSKIRLISHRSFGFHSAQALIALACPCCARITIDAPMNFTDKPTGAPTLTKRTTTCFLNRLVLALVVVLLDFEC